MDRPPARLDDLIAYVTEQHPSGDPLQCLAAAVATAGVLGELTDHLVGHFVDQARHSGATWAEIGQSLGVTKQAVQKRFVTRPFEHGPTFVGSPGGKGPDRYSRFTKRAQTAVISAQHHARTMGHDHVAPLHLVLGLLDETDALATRAVIAQGVSLDDVRCVAIAELGPGADVQPEHLPFGPDSKKLLEMASRQALLLGHNYIGTEHMLLAVVRETDSAAGRLLANAGVDSEMTQQWIVAKLAKSSKR